MWRSKSCRVSMHIAHWVTSVKWCGSGAMEECVVSKSWIVFRLRLRWCDFESKATTHWIRDTTVFFSSVTDTGAGCRRTSSITFVHIKFIAALNTSVRCGRRSSARQLFYLSLSLICWARARLRPFATTLTHVRRTNAKNIMNYEFLPGQPMRNNTYSYN